MRRFVGLFIILLMFSNVSAVWSEESAPKETVVKPWSVDLKVKYFFSSHTSYEFGNPFPPGQAPLSRLEFPMNSWWAGLEARRNLWRFSGGIEVMRNLSQESDGVFKDSDWTDDRRPYLKTIYSESGCSMDPSYTLRADLDMKVSDWLKLPVWFDLRPVLGFRWQRLAFVTHDGVQYSSEENNNRVDYLPGDGIRFDQTYWQYFAGLRGFHDLGKPLKLSRLTLHWQLDWAYLEGKNQDHHLLRDGNRFTYESTDGNAWHAALGLKIGLTKSINAGVELDYLRIRTTGNHRLVNNPYTLDINWNNGVEVWSDQMNVMMNLEYIF